MSDVDRYLPRIAHARDEGVVVNKGWGPLSTNLLASTPDEEVPMAVVIVDAKVNAREAREKAIQMPMSAVGRLPTEVPKGIPQSIYQRTIVLVERAGAPSDCEMCEIRRGRMPCARCGGTGKVATLDDQSHQRIIPCGSCDKGFVTCSTCDGKGNALWVKVMEIDDRARTLHYAYVPSMTDALDLAVGPHFDPMPRPLPECLLFDPAPARKQSAYRGDTTRDEVTFAGHSFGDALPRATTAIAGLAGKGEAMRSEVRTYAWPLLWLRYRSLTRRGEICLLVSPATGRTAAVVA